MINKIGRFSLILLLILGTGGHPRFNAPAKNLPPASSSPDAERWFKANTIVLTYASKSKGMAATWKMETNDGNDFLLTVNEQDGQTRQIGSIMVIAGRMMLTKGLKMEKGYEIDELDGRVLMIQLGLNLLARAFPNGPESVGSNAEVNLIERQSAIAIHTPSAGGEFPPPWTLKGMARTPAANQVEFKLNFTYSDEENPKAKETLEFSGIWQINPTAIALGDDTPLGGWQAFMLGPIKSESAGGTIYDYGASRMRQFATLGELRHSLKAQPPAQSTEPRKPGKAPRMTNNN